jgi:hypothetical protein
VRGVCTGPVFQFSKKKKTERFFLSFPISIASIAQSQRCAPKPIQKTITKPSRADIETIDELAVALPIQQRLVFRMAE